jgi:uncharacterized protein (TIGR03437 family)
MPQTKKLLMMVIVTGLLCARLDAQSPSAVTLEIDLENLVNYIGDIADPARFAIDPAIGTPNAPRNFHPVVVLGDIVAVNGQPAKGTFVFHSRVINLSPTANPGQAIADITRANVNDQVFEMLNPDGTVIGSIMAFGLGGGAGPPGAPLAITQGNNAISGGTGAFLGIRGQVGQAVTPQTVANRVTSMVEDPASRRRNGGGRTRFVASIIPMSRPQIVTTSSGPGVAHSNDFSLVITVKPAAPGEILSVFVTGLGPTRPGVDPGKPFPVAPAALVSSPIEVTVNGRPAELLAAVGFPGAVDGYQVNFRVPPDTVRGVATIQVTSAWIAALPVNMTVQ